MTKQVYLVWNLTNYDAGFEILGAYTTKARAEKAYRAEMKARYGTTNEDKLLDLWEKGEYGSSDSWRITKVYVVE